MPSIFNNVTEVAEDLLKTSMNGMEKNTAKALIAAAQDHDIEVIKFQLNKLSSSEAEKILKEIDSNQDITTKGE